MINKDAIIKLFEVYQDTFKNLDGIFNCIIETHEEYIKDLRAVVDDLYVIMDDTKDTIQQLKEEKNDV